MIILIWCYYIVSKNRAKQIDYQNGYSDCTVIDACKFCKKNLKYFAGFWHNASLCGHRLQDTSSPTFDQDQFKPEWIYLK